MLLFSDVAKKVIAKDRAPERVNVYEIMAKPVLTVRPDMEVRYCARLFENFGISHAPVVEDGKVVGLVSCWYCTDYCQILSDSSDATLPTQPAPETAR